MVTRSEVLEKFLGRRLVSCLGWCLLLFVLLVLSALAYSYFKGEAPEKPPAPSPPRTLPPRP